jgi:hypothetical protein
MSHEFFFSYASENLDATLKGFFELLCEDVAPYTAWAKDDPRISFRDGKDLPLMEGWRPALLNALQTSAVMVCVTSVAYFQKPFCGQEYYIFDQRRRQGLAAGAKVPRVVLPVLWAPLDAKLPFFDDIQIKAAGMSEVYWTKGLRYLKKFDPSEYEKCVMAFAEAIHRAAKEHSAIPPLADVEPFDQIPNAFAGGVWEEAAGPGGWVPGPGVANFVFAAAIGDELQKPPGRYGMTPSDWRPYLPPEARTIADISREAAKKNSLRYREIVVDQKLAQELKGARDRKNLTLVLADPQTLPIHQYQPVATFDSHTWEGTALLMLWDGAAGPWEDLTLQTVVSKTFPIRTQLKPPSYLAPVRSITELETVLDTTLADLRGALTKAEAEKKEKIDEPPAQVSGQVGAGT